MASEVFIGLHGGEDQTKATFPFVMASGALDAGYQTAIIVVGDAVVLMNSTVADNVHGVGLPPLRDVMAKVVAAESPSTYEGSVPSVAGQLKRTWPEGTHSLPCRQTGQTSSPSTIG